MKSSEFVFGEHDNFVAHLFRSEPEIEILVPFKVLVCSPGVPNEVTHSIQLVNLDNKVRVETIRFDPDI